MSEAVQPFLAQESENVRVPRFAEVLLKMADDLEELKELAQQTYGVGGNLYQLDSAAMGLRAVAGQYLTRKPKNEAAEAKFELVLDERTRGMRTS